MSSKVDRRFGVQVAAARRNLGVTQDELGRAVGYSAQHVSNIERGTYLPGKVAMAALVRVLDFAPAVLALWDEARALDNPEGREKVPPFPPVTRYGKVVYYTPAGRPRPVLESKVEASRVDTGGVILDVLKVIRYPCDLCDEAVTLEERDPLPAGWSCSTDRFGSAIGIVYLCPGCKEASA